MPPGKSKKPEEQIRVFLFDDEPVIRSMLVRICSSRGYDVHAFLRPRLCRECRCKKGEACADIVISDVSMPGLTGIEFLTNQFIKECKVQKMALMSGTWTEAQIQKAHSLGCRVFHKPLDIKELKGWLTKCEEEIHTSERKLASWFLGDASGIADLTD